MATGLNALILFNSERYRWGAFPHLPGYRHRGVANAADPGLWFVCAALAHLCPIAYNLLLLISVWKFFGLQPFDQTQPESADDPLC